MFNRFDGTNTMRVEITGLQRRFCHLAPQSKYLNCHNHGLALVFVHLIPKYQAPVDAGAVILTVWKIMKYSSVKAAVFTIAESAEGLKNVKLPKAATR